MERKNYHPDYWDAIPHDWKKIIDRMYRKEYNSERCETRRHQSLEKSMERGFDVPDLRVNVLKTVIRREEKITIHNALKLLTDKQRIVLVAYAVHDRSFRKIGDKLGISKVTVREYYLAAVKKMKRILKNTLSKRVSRGS